ncbi:MAG: hypothetical protein A2945_04425 [Candidatus Liptonbacteria bacterium RIFCSPLOWO2_01_FULL_52_25]|uniref:Uncharacterized protein n=1 Tax=Candidatus Liptonbacteria bacterium RIFCSPLOWO2_01_FULL_52_25 TaxID=1798650 RepID=A0A1G2CFT1_9BACT|nr:MAG: hypothetical protein A2945_04425 [Candidatus Liptonbacteria bacterium RIFCSPLOWO2_01_FULL_52_25]
MKRITTVFAIISIFAIAGCGGRQKQAEKDSSAGTKTQERIVRSPGRGIVQEKRKFPVTVNYDLTIEQAVAAGTYFSVDPDLTSKQFPRTRRGVESVDIALVCFADEVGSDAAARELEGFSFRSANVRELLAFGATYPKFQEENSIMALEGSPDGRKGLRLYGSPGERNVTLYWGDTTFPDECFSAVSSARSRLRKTAPP